METFTLEKFRFLLFKRSKDSKGSFTIYSKTGCLKNHDIHNTVSGVNVNVVGLLSELKEYT